MVTSAFPTRRGFSRASTHAFNNAAWPYIRQIADEGLDQALQMMPALRRGLAVREGQIVNEALATAFQASIPRG